MLFMQFQVPQFTEHETKLIGPFTLKQFLWIAGGAMFIYILSYIVTPSYLLFFAIPIAILSLAFAFIKVESVPLIKYVGYAVLYFLKIERYRYMPPDDQKYLEKEKH